jgi:cobalt-zinc-cadmium efflux system outer membrane protein
VKTICLMAAFAAATSGAQLQDLVREALANNPEIQAAQKRYEAARQRPAQESSMPDPMLSVGYASNGGPIPGQGLGSAPTSNIGVMVSQQLPSVGKRKLRGDIALKEADAEFQQYLAAQLGVRSRVTQAYHRLHHAYAALEIVASGKDLLNTVLRVSEARYAAGKAAQPDILKAQTQLSILEARAIQLQQDRDTAEAELNALLNRRPGTPLDRPADIESAPLNMTLEQLLAAASEEAPALRRGQKMIERSELAVNLARRDFHSDTTLSAGYFNMGGMPAMYEVRVEIPVHLHTSEKQKPALDQQVHLLSEARRNLEAAGQSLQFRIREQYLTARTAWKLMQLYADTILPQSGLTIESSLAGYQTGGADLLTVLSNVTVRIDAEERYHEQKMMYAVALAKLEELTGVSLEEGKR